MFRSVFSFVLAVSLLVSCSGVIESDGCPCALKSGMFTFSVNMSGVKSFTDVLPWESAMGNAYIYVFDAGFETLERMIPYTGEPVQARIVYGQKYVCFVANCVPFDYPLNYSSFKDAMHDISVVDGYGMPMYGESLLELSSSYSGVVNIVAERMMSRVHLASISNNLVLGSSRKEIYPLRAYLTNVPARCSFKGDVSQESSSWLSKYGRVDGGSSGDLLIDDGNFLYPSLHFYYVDADRVPVSYGGRFLPASDFDALFYTFPNPTAVDVNGFSEGEWIPRYTRLVVVVGIDGKDYFYPVNLVGLRRNVSYNVNLNITRLGSLDPDTFEFVNSDDVTIDFGGIEEGGDVSIDF